MAPAGRGLLLVLVLAASWTAPLQAKRTSKAGRQGPTRSGPAGPPPPQPPSQPARAKPWKRQLPVKETTGRPQPLQAEPALLLPPADTWRAFIRHTEESARRARQRRKKQKRRRRPGELPLPVRRGPAGPPGPPGPPGAVVTTDRLVDELREMIQEAAGEHLSSLLHRSNKTDPETERKDELPPLFRLNEVALVSRVQTAFHVHLAEKTAIPPKMFMELSKYKLPFGGGSLQRGDALDLRSGRFRAPEAGVYQLSAQIFLRHRSSKAPRSSRRRVGAGSGRHRALKLLRVLICIDSLCKRHSSLQFITSLESSPRLLTATVHGILELARGQYASVHVDNASRVRLVALKGSQFSGAMLGR